MSDPDRRGRWVYFAVALLILSGIGIRNGWVEWPGAETAAQKLATLTEVGYGILGLVGALAVYFALPGARVVLWIWALCLGVTAGLAPVVWGGSPAWVGVLSGVSAGLLGIAVIWMSQRQGIPQ